MTIIGLTEDHKTYIGCYPSDICIKKAEIKFSANLLIAYFLNNIMRHFMAEVVPFVLMNHPVLPLQVK